MAQMAPGLRDNATAAPASGPPAPVEPERAGGMLSSLYQGIRQASDESPGVPVATD